MWCKSHIPPELSCLDTKNNVVSIEIGLLLAIHVNTMMQGRSGRHISWVHAAHLSTLQACATWVVVIAQNHEAA